MLVFGAHGVKDLATRYSMGRLAASLAQAGHPVLRFDLPGTGDSLGDWDAPNLVQQWQAAGLSAAQWLKTWSGSEHIGIVGLRLGGMIATQVAVALAESDKPVLALALLAPVVQGRRYIRELKALSDGSAELRVAGFPTSVPTQQALGAVDLSHLPVPPSQRIFIGIPPISRGLTELAHIWSQQAEVTTSPYADMAEHIGNPTFSRAPAELFNSLEAWFDTLPPVSMGHVAPTSRSTGSGTPISPSNSRLDGADFHEEGVIIPANVGLAGIWCLPTPQVPNAPTVIICNAGRNPHIGWARGSVRMARQLATQGICSLRFDLAGLGDSPPMADPPEEILYNAVGIPQLKAVIDHVRAIRGHGSDIHVLGACSGGFLAFHEAVTDPRVAGLVLVNVQKFIWQPGASLQAAMRTSGKSVAAYRQRLFSPETWVRLIKGEVDLKFVARKFYLKGLENLRQKFSLTTTDGNESGVGKKEGAGVVSATGLITDIRHGFSTMCQRGTHVLVLYSEEDGGRDEFARYLGANGQAFTDQPRTKLVILPGTDHDLTPQEARDQLTAEIALMCRATSKSPKP